MMPRIEGCGDGPEAISRLFESGFNVMEVATISGHKCLLHLKRYIHIKPESLVARLG